MTVCDACRKPDTDLVRVEVLHSEGVPAHLMPDKNGGHYLKEGTGTLRTYVARRELCNDCRRKLAKFLAAWGGGNIHVDESY